MSVEADIPMPIVRTSPLQRKFWTGSAPARYFLISVLALSGCAGDDDHGAQTTATPTPTLTATMLPPDTATPSPTSSRTPTPSAQPTSTRASSATTTPTQSPTTTPSQSPTDSPSPTATPTHTPVFVEFAWRTDLPDVRTERLCEEAADPDRAPDTTFIHCAIEGATFAPARLEPKDQIVVLAYNILRGFQAGAQLAAMMEGGEIPLPDVLLLSEVDRGCRRTDFRNVARDYAEALGYYYVYATEFVELPSVRNPDGPFDPPLCEHGNAIVSRYPLGNVREIRHAENRSWYTPPDFPDPDEPRLGGRVAVAADVKIGQQLVRLYALHLESTLSALAIRDAQALEIAEDASSVSYPVIAGGDLNAYGAIGDFRNGTAMDGPTQAFLTHGFSDAHATLSIDDRITSFDVLPLIIDFIFVRGAEAAQPGLCPRESCGQLSDHLPVWTTVRVP